MEKQILQIVLEKQANGKIAEAKAILKEALSQSPNDIELLDQLAYINVQSGSLEKAKDLLLQALDQAPSHSPLLYVHLGQVYRLLNQPVKAVDCYEKALDLFPDSAEILYQYGLLHFQQGDYSRAVSTFTKALKLQPDHIDAMYNLALSLNKDKKQEEAVACLLAIFELDSQHVRARYLLGKWLLAKKLYKDADQQFQVALSSQPEDKVILGSIIQSFLEENRFEEAKPYCERYIELHPQAFEMYYNLGVIATCQGYVEDAISHYHVALQIQPTYFPALNNLAVLYLKRHNLEAANHYFREALKQQPDNISIQYTLSAISGNTDYREAPQEYIRNLFDQYATHFDQHLCDALDYSVPLKLKLLIEKHYSGNKQQWIVLDLGCGTGLCGKHVKPWASKLIGVDLSPRMLDVAKQKEIYDELVIAENLDYLQDRQTQFDLIVAGDVFVYQGDLQPIFERCFHALKPEGLLVFSTEIGQNNDFVMQSTGRFTHSLTYIENLAQSIGYRVLAKTIDMTRIQGSEPLAGYYFIFQKK